MRDAATVARYAEKAYAHIGAILQGRTLPFTIEFGDLSANVLTLGVTDGGDLIATFTWAKDGIQQFRSGGVEELVVTNPPLYVADPRGDVKIGGVRHRYDPLAIASETLHGLLKRWSR